MHILTEKEINRIENPCKDCYAKWVGGCADCEYIPTKCE